MSTPTDPQNAAPEPGEGAASDGPPPPYGAQPPAYGAPPPYGAQPPAYGAPPPAYDAPAPAYGAPPSFGYGAPGSYGYGGGTEKNSLAVWALVLGILSIPCCGFFAGIPAVILGNNSRKAAAQGLATNGNLGQIGMILGWIGIVLGTLWFIFSASRGFDYNYNF